MKHSKQSASFAGVLTAVTVAILPFVTSRHLFYGAVNAKFFFVVGAVSICVLYLAYLLIKGKHTVTLRRRWLLLILFLVLGVHYLSSVVGVYTTGSFLSDIIRSSGIFFLTFIAFFAFWLSELLSSRDWTIVRRTVAVSSAVFAFLSFFGPEGLGVAGRFLTVNFEISGLTLGNSTFAGAYLLLGFVITLIELSRSDRGSKLRRWFSVLALIQVLSPLLLFERLWAGASFTGLFGGLTAFLGAARASGATAVLIVLYVLGLWLLERYARKQSRRHIVVAWNTVWIIGVLILVGLLFVPGNPVQDKYIETSSEARVIVWQEGFSAVREKPLFGWGPENFRFAHDRYFDNRLYLEENLGEVWFDRSHNVVVDTLVSVGFVGALSILLLWVYFIRVVVRARRNRVIGNMEAHLLGALVLAHFLQLQTSFETITTYVLVGLVLGYGLWLEREMVEKEPKESGETKETEQALWLGRGVGLGLVILVVFSSYYLLFGEYARQRALFSIFKTQDNKEQLVFIDVALYESKRLEPLRLSSSSLIRGFLEGVTESGGDQKRVSATATTAIEQLNAYEKHFREYLSRAEDDYRARMNYVYILLVKTGLGENRIKDAQVIISDSYQLSPENPLTYALDAVALLYSGDVVSAKEKAKEAIALNPEATFSHEILDYIERQEKKLPRVTILRLGNL